MRMVKIIYQMKTEKNNKRMVGGHKQIRRDVGMYVYVEDLVQQMFYLRNNTKLCYSPKNIYISHKAQQFGPKFILLTVKKKTDIRMDLYFSSHTTVKPQISCFSCTILFVIHMILRCCIQDKS